MDRFATIFAVTSGKGGVGKTQICANLAVSLADMGKRVCILDADHGLANINLVLGLPPRHSNNGLSSEEVYLQLYQNFNPHPFILQLKLGVDLLPAKSGLSTNLHHLPPPSEQQIKNMLDNMRAHYDVILIDTAAGIEDNVKNYLAAADHTLVIINTEPTSLTDSFGLIRRMQKVVQSFEIIVNQVPSPNAATNIYRRFAGAVKKYIGSDLSVLGYVREDTLVSAALLSQRILVKYSPNCIASLCIKRIANELIGRLNNSAIKTSRPKGNTSFKNKSKLENQKPKLTRSKDETSALDSIVKSSNPKVIFDNWINQINQQFNDESLTSHEKNKRVQMLMSHLELICEQDHEFLSALESLVVNLGIDKDLEKKTSDLKLSRFNLSGNSILS